MKPIAFKVRGGGNYSGTKGGAVRPNEKGGTGALWYIDKTFTIASTQDQFIATSTIHERTQQPMSQPTSTPQIPLRFLSVCSGMEAASVAWEPLGWKAVGFSEIEPFPCAVLAHRFPNTLNYGSLTEYQSWPLEPGAIDLLVGGTPCQSFSVAGLRKGLADPRGNLALTFLGLADKLKPRWIVWENVPGVLSSGGGRDFGSFLGALVELGYGFAYRVLDAQHFGVPQRRRRVFVVACLGDWRAAAEVLSLREGLRGYLETGNKKRKGPAADAGASVEAGGLQRTVGTLCADTHPGAYSGQDAYTGRLIPAVLTPVSHWDGGNVRPTLNQSAKGIGGVGSSNQELFSQGGAYLVPGEPIPIQDGREMEKNQNGLGIANQGGPAYTIDTTGAQAAAIPYRKSKRASSTTDDESWVPADASNTLNNFDLGDTRTTHAVVQPIPIQGTIIGRSENAGPQGAGATEGGPMFTLTKTDIHGVCHQMPGSVAPTIGASGPPYSRTGNERVEAEALTQTSLVMPLTAWEGAGSVASVFAELNEHAPDADMTDLLIWMSVQLVKRLPPTTSRTWLSADTLDDSNGGAARHEERVRDEVRGQALERVAVGHGLPLSLGALVRGLHDAADLVVDLAGDLVRVVRLRRELAAEERLAVVVAEHARAELVAHAELGDHPAGQVGRLLDVVARTGRGIAEDQPLGDVAAKQSGDLVLELRLRLEVAVLHGQPHRVTEGHAAADDRDLGDRIALGQDPLDDGVTTFVIGDDRLLGVGDDP
mgnify:CR=1 FL=1